VVSLGPPYPAGPAAPVRTPFRRPPKRSSRRGVATSDSRTRLRPQNDRDFPVIVAMRRLQSGAKVLTSAPGFSPARAFFVLVAGAAGGPRRTVCEPIAAPSSRGPRLCVARVRAARRSYMSRPRKARSTLAVPGRLRTDQVVTDHALAPAFAPRGVGSPPSQQPSPLPGAAVGVPAVSRPRSAPWP
jgi:hypothetical protein